MTFFPNKPSVVLIFIGLSLIYCLPTLAQTASPIESDTANNNPGRPTTVYFLRHAETLANHNCNSVDCDERLSDKGSHRANLLASWFLERRVLQTLDGVFTDNTHRTYQTVLPAATLADLDITRLPFDNNLSPDSRAAGFECATINAIMQTSAGSTLLVAGDSNTLYNMMGDGNLDCAGLELLSDEDASSHRFPKNSFGQVRDYGDVWKVVIRGGIARFVYRVNLETTQLSVIDRAR